MSLQNSQLEYLYPPGTWDEMIDGKIIRKQYEKVFDVIQKLSTVSLQQKEKVAGDLFMNQGITFTVYSDNEGIERIFPFDIIPRVITSTEWTKVEKGIQQLIGAINNLK